MRSLNNSQGQEQQAMESPSFEDLYHANRERIFRLVYGFVNNSADAEDLLQEIFCKAFTAIHRFSSNKGAGFSSWLYRIGINHTISFVRMKKRQKRGNPAPLPDDQILKSTDNSDPQAMMENREIKSYFQECLHTLSSRQKTIIVLRYYNNLKIREIARQLKCSEGSIKKQIFRALSRLRRKMGSLYHKEKDNEMQKI